jgi:hypothetical protein
MTNAAQPVLTANNSRHQRLLENPMAIMEFVTGGNAMFTVKNIKTGNRATYKAIKPDIAGTLFQVWVFTGDNNLRKTHYKCIGVVEPNGQYRAYGWRDAAAALEAKMAEGLKGHWIDKHQTLVANTKNYGTPTANQEFRLRGACNKYGVAKPGEVPATDKVRHAAFAWIWNQIRFGTDLPPVVEVWHEGACCRCGHKLSVPASIEIGHGPDCCHVLGIYEEWKALDTKLGADLVAYAEELNAERGAAA